MFSLLLGFRSHYIIDEGLYRSLICNKLSGKLTLGLSEVEKRQRGSANYFLKGDKVYIQAYHPGYWGISEEIYCNDIIIAAKNILNEKK
ncbi:hypothetical protein [Daejeonella sp.]|uniref:hypothetical protein n=1 Tax=Daejeonella sp. TaxID=2805397 RepID=UPI0030C5C333